MKKLQEYFPQLYELLFENPDKLDGSKKDINYQNLL